MIAAIGYGLVLGLCALFPGFHYALVLLVAGPWLISHLGMTHGLVAMVVSVGVARSSHTLAVVYHPVAADQLAVASPAQKLALRGQGRAATRLMGEGLWLGTLGACGIVLVGLMARDIWDADLFKVVLDAKAITWPVILFWLGYTVWRSRSMFGTLLAMTGCGLIGYWSLNSPALLGHPQAFTPMLVGIFAVPTLWYSLWQKGGRPAEQVETNLHATEPHLGYMGCWLGLIAVALPGLGASSLVSAFQGVFGEDDEANYLMLAQITETCGETLALVIGVLGIARHSADASTIGTILGTSWIPGTQLGYLLPLLIALGVWVGLHVVRLIGSPYRWLIHKIPLRVQSVVVGSWVLWTVWDHTGTYGMWVVLAGFLVVLGARRFHVPNQAFMVCLIAPMIMNL